METLTTSEKIKIISSRKKKTITELAQDVGMSKQNMYGKLKRNNWCEQDLRKIANALDAKIEITFVIDEDRV